MYNKINLSNKIYPLFYGLASYMIFWISINALFLTTVKKLSIVEINSLTTYGTIASIIVYLFSYKIIKKIGNLNSIKLGVWMFLISSLLLTFSTRYLFILIGIIL